MKIRSRWDSTRVLFEDESKTMKETVIAAVRLGANLEGADLEGANLGGADLRGADLGGANLGGDTILTDGRSFEAWKLDPLAGLCREPEARSRALAAWSKHSWSDCPMHAAHGWSGWNDAPVDKRAHVGCFVALFDAFLLPEPKPIDPPSGATVPPSDTTPEVAP